MTERTDLPEPSSKLKPDSGPRIGVVLAAAGILGLGAVSLLTPLQGSPAAAERPIAYEGPAVPQNGFADLVEGVLPAVVSVRVEDEGRLETIFRRFHDHWHEHEDDDEKDRRRGSRHRFHGSGSGFFVSPDGHVVTNDIEIRDGDRILVALLDGEEHEASLVGTDAVTDLALLKLDLDEPSPYLAFAEEDNLRVGDWVVAVGNPLGLGGTVNSGVVSALGRDFGAVPHDSLIRIGATLDRGSSGGPAFDLNGKVVGVNATTSSPERHSDGVGFAVPASTAASVVAELMQDGVVSRGWLGVRTTPLDEDMAGSLGLGEAAGAVVLKVQSDSPAETAGLRSGDVILKVDGEEIESPRVLSRLIASLDSGHNGTMHIWRDGGEQEIAVVLGAFPDRSRHHRKHRRGHHL